MGGGAINETNNASSSSSIANTTTVSSNITRSVNAADEPLYCTCHEISYGQMIMCDNDACKIEWFHFGCVKLNAKPKGKWYCPECRGETHKVMKKIHHAIITTTATPSQASASPSYFSATTTTLNLTTSATSTKFQ